MHYSLYQMEICFAAMALCAGNPPFSGGFPPLRPVTRSFDVFIDLRMNKRLNKQSRRLCFDTSSRALWRHNKYGRAVASIAERIQVCGIRAHRCVSARWNITLEFSRYGLYISPLNAEPIDIWNQQMCGHMSAKLYFSTLRWLFKCYDVQVYDKTSC